MIKAFILAVVIIGLFVLAALAFHRRANASLQHPPMLPPVTEPASKPRVALSGWSRAELDRILSDFCSLYDLDQSATFTIAATSTGHLLMTFPEDPEPAKLMFLINYLHYPRDFALDGRQIAVLGSFTVTSAYAPPDRALIGRKAIIYVPANDTDYALVYVKTDIGGTFEVSFTNLKWKSVEAERLPHFVDDLQLIAR